MQLQPELKLVEIKAGLGLSISKFEKLRRAVREEVEWEGLVTIRLATKSMPVILHKLVGTVMISSDKKFSAYNNAFDKKAILKLVHIGMLLATSLPNAMLTQMSNTIPTQALWLPPVFRPH